MVKSFIDTQITRCNRNVLVLNALLLAVCALGVAVTSNYWYNFVFGPFTADYHSLFEPDGPSLGFEKKWIVIMGDQTYDPNVTEVAHIEKEKGEYFNEQVIASYLLVRFRDRGLIVKSPMVTNATSFEGSLVSAPPEVYAKVVKRFGGLKISDRVMLDVCFYRLPGYQALFWLSIASIFALRNIGKVLLRMKDVNRHPVMVALRKFGEPSAVADRVNAAMASERPAIYGRSILLPNWLITKRFLDLHLVPFDDVIWICKHKTRHWLGFDVTPFLSVPLVPVGATYKLLVGTKDGRMHEWHQADYAIDAMIDAICKNQPWLVGDLGYSEGLVTEWKKNPDKLISQVQASRKEYETKMRKQGN